MIKEFTTKRDLNSYINPMIDPATATLISAGIGAGGSILGGLFGGGEAEDVTMGPGQAEMITKQQSILGDIMGSWDALDPFILSNMGMVWDTDPNLVSLIKQKENALEGYLAEQLADDHTPRHAPAMRDEIDSLKAQLNKGLRRMTEDERVGMMSPSEKKMYENYNLKLDRERLALKGELPISEGSQQRYDQARSEFETSMSRRLGPNWRTSSPGARAEKEFEQGWRSTLDAERRGELATAGAGIESSYGLLERGRGEERTGLYGYSARKGGLIGAYGDIGKTFQDYDVTRAEGDIYSQQIKAGKTAGLIETGGYLAGKTFDYYAGGQPSTDTPKRKAGLLDTTNRTSSKSYYNA